MVKLGDVVKDKISGFTGLVITIQQRLYNTDRVEIQPYSMREGKPLDTHWFDILRVEVIESEKVIGFDLSTYIRRGEE